MSGGLRIGDLAKACENLECLSLNRWSFFFVFKPRGNIFCVSCKLRDGISLDDTKKSFVAKANAEVARFMKLQVDSELNGRQMLQALLKVYPEGIPETFNGIGILPSEVAALIRNKNCHAVYFHPLKLRWFFASKLHKEVAEARLGNP